MSKFPGTKVPHLPRGTKQDALPFTSPGLKQPPRDLARLADDQLRTELTAEFRRLGFKFITLDLEGFRSGSLNQLVQIT